MSDSAVEARRAAIARDESLPDIDWAVPPSGTVVSEFAAPSGRLATWSLGDPAHPRVVLVAGATGSKEDFHFLLPEIASAGYRVESFDLAGNYESSTAGPWNLDPTQPRYTLRLFVDDMIAFLEAGSTPAHLLGYSFAGMVAAVVAVERPELIASLTFLGTPPDPGQSFAGVKRLGPFSSVATPRAAAALMRWGVELNVLHVKPGRLAFVRDRFRLTRRDAHRDIMAIMMQAPDVEAGLRALDVPKAVAVGEHDLWPLERHARFAESIGASISVYRTGHSPCEDAPYELATDMLALFEKARPES